MRSKNILAGEDPKEKEISEKWEGLLKEKSIPFISESIPSKKGLYFCQIN